MYGNKEYQLALALLQFNQAWTSLVTISKQLPDMDLSELYPFFLLDFEEIQPAVKQWCLVHAGNILTRIPDRVPNPACVACKYVKAGITPDGVCTGAKEVNCTNYPVIQFARELVVPFLASIGVDTTNMSDAVVQATYLREVDAKYAAQKST